MTKPNPERGLNLERTVFFSDAVIAIAMTLLAIELPLPQGDTPSAVWHSFLHNFGGEYLAFLISFAVIAGFWYQHHRFFERVGQINGRLILWNLLSLLAIVLIPFATRMLSSEAVGLHGQEDDGYALGPVFYATIMLAWGAAYVMMVLAANKGRLWHEDIPASAPGTMIFGACAGLAMFAVSIPIAFVDTGLAQLSWILIPVVSRVSGIVRRRLSGGVQAPARSSRPRT